VAVRLVIVACVIGLTAGPAHPSGAATASKTARVALASRVPVARRQQMGAIVRAWSARLNANDNAGIARLFAVPATLIQGPYVYRLVTRRQIALWHSGLPCSGRIVSIAYRGRFATAVFRLGNRGATKCDQPGTLAAARFEIVGGKIVSWAQVPVPERPTSPGTVA